MVKGSDEEEWRKRKAFSKSSTDVVGKTLLYLLIPSVIFFLRFGTYKQFTTGSECQQLLLHIERGGVGVVGSNPATPTKL